MGALAQEEGLDRDKRLGEGEVKVQGRESEVELAWGEYNIHHNNCDVMCYHDGLIHSEQRRPRQRDKDKDKLHNTTQGPAAPNKGKPLSLSFIV